MNAQLTAITQLLLPLHFGFFGRAADASVSCLPIQKFSDEPIDFRRDAVLRQCVTYRAPLTHEVRTFAQRRDRQPPAIEAPPSDFVARIRGELTNTLSRVREAVELPWNDLTAATLAELRFNSIAGWLPNDEASELRVSFQREMTGLYTTDENET
jgi:hypothetical protein